jgi:hypothetical protein
LDGTAGLKLLAAIGEATRLDHRFYLVENFSHD